MVTWLAYMPWVFDLWPLLYHSWHGCAVLSDCSFLIHGGYDGNNALSDAFIFNTGENKVLSPNSIARTLIVTIYSTVQKFGVGKIFVENILYMPKLH